MKIKPISKVNPVAKHSRNKSGAGTHKSAKDYSRKTKHKSTTEIESVSNKLERINLLKAMQNSCNNYSLWCEYQDQIFLIEEEIDG